MEKWQPFKKDSFQFDSIQEIPVWLLPLDVSESFLQILQSFLSNDEKERAERFRFDHLRKHFIAARGQLRLLLGQYLQCAPQTIRFRYNTFGKPYLEEDTLYFNLSHAHQWALMAFHPNWELGVDIEWIKPDFDGLHLVKRFFSKNEIEQMQKIPEPLKKEAFYNGWTRKEAYIKALGRGLNIPLSGFSVTLSNHEPARIIETSHEPQNLTKWSLQAIPAPEGYKAAIVAKTQNFKILLLDGRKLNELVEK